MKSAEQEQFQRLSEVQEINRSLKRVRQQKSALLRQMVSENKSQNCDKFNKFIFSLLAAKLEIHLAKNVELFHASNG